MYRYTLRSVLAHLTRLGLTAAAIVLGVGTVAGTFVLTDTARVAADAAFTDADRGVDVVMVGVDPATDDVAHRIEVGDLPPVPADLVERIARVDGVAAVTGAVIGNARLVGRNGRMVGGGRAPVGRSLDASFAGLLSGGRLPAGPEEVVIDRTTARQQRFGVGDRVRVVVFRPAPNGSAKGGDFEEPAVPHAMMVVGVLDSPEYPDWVLVGFDPATARETLGIPGAVSAIEVRGASGVSERALRARVAAAAPGAYAITGTALAAARSVRAQPDDVIRQVALIGAAVALFVGMFVIRNTFTIILASRARELALLRCVGASRGQLRRSALLESSIVGLLASVAGLVFGVVLAWGLGLLLRSTGELRVDTMGTVPRVMPRTVVVALAVGVVTAVLSAWGPARRAALVAPVAALRGDVFAVHRRESRLRAGVGAVLTCAGFGLVLLGVLGEPVRTAYVQIGAAAIAAGILVLGPVLARSLSSLLGAPIAHAGAPGLLACRNAGRSPRRTSATVLPLVLGLTLITLTTTLATATKAWAVSEMDRTFTADLRVQSLADPRAGGSTPLSRRVVDRLTGLPELGAVAAFRGGGVSVVARDAGVTSVLGVDPSGLAPVLALPVTAGALADVAPGTVAVSRRVADATGLTLGSMVPVRGPRGEQTLTVRAIYARPELGYIAAEQLDVPVGDYLVTASDYERLAAADDTAVAAVYLATRAGVSERAARTAIDRALADDPRYPTIEILSAGELRDRLSSRIDPALRIYYSLLGLLVVIALFGIVNTLALHIVERAREIGLVRAVGMDRRQVLAMIRWEAVLVAVIGTAVGTSVGTFLGWALSRALALPVTVPVRMLMLIAAGAVLVVWLGAVLPARRAARVDVLRALAAD